MGKRKGRAKLHIHIFKLMLANARQAKIIQELEQENAEITAVAAEEMRNSFMSKAPEPEKTKRH